MKYTTVKISEIAAHPTRRMDPGYWIKKKSHKQQANLGRVGPKGTRSSCQGKKLVDFMA